MDDADRADSDIERLLTAQIANARQSTSRLLPNGRCYNCDEPLADGFLYCDNNCREDHEHRTRRNRNA